MELKRKLKPLTLISMIYSKRFYEAHRQLTEDNVLITAETIRNKFLGKSEKPRCLIEIFKDHNKKMEATLIGYDANHFIK